MWNSRPRRWPSCVLRSPPKGLTRCIERKGSTLKGGIRGVYHSVGKKYLQTYLDEYAFRYNRRDQGNLIFTSILERVFERAS